MPWSCPLQTTGPPESPCAHKGYGYSANGISLSNEPEIPEITDFGGSPVRLTLHKSSTKALSDSPSPPDATVPDFSSKGTTAEDESAASFCRMRYLATIQDMCA